MRIDIAKRIPDGGIGYNMGMAQRRLRAGVAKVDITPDLSKIRIQLGGYGARLNMPPRGIHDPIYARALALEVGSQQAVIVALDHLLVPWSLTRRVAEATGLKPEQLFMSASHTHCAPDAMGLNERMRFPLPGVGTFTPPFLEFTTERVVQAVEQARRSMKPATLHLNAAALPNLNRNRRGRRLVDTTMSVARLDDTRSKPFAALVVYAAHPTIYPHTMMEVSAEFPGVLQNTLERVLGRDGVALYLNGAQGDVSPVADAGKDDHDRVQRYGGLLAQHAQHLLKDAKPASPTLRMRHAQARLPEAQPHPEFQQSAGREYKVPETLLKQIAKEVMPETAPISCLALGDLLLVGFPGEPISSLGLQTREIGHEAGHKYIAPVALVNDWIGYILTRHEYLKGGYEATVSFNGPDAGDAVMQSVREGVRTL
ncbi:MAG: neutral/alkaline non-lysosomal ceramidase N-terminal domain-containing protein [Fimbriimonadales bacterium]|nr:neutral/alkaline non-lysosomal ceramidase N-terminal domain-containing protein [Fimbriimonadales bacterium]